MEYFAFQIFGLHQILKEKVTQEPVLYTHLLKAIYIASHGLMTLLHGIKFSGEVDYHSGRSSGSLEQLGWFHGSSSWLQPLSVARLRSSAARDAQPFPSPVHDDRRKSGAKDECGT